MATGRPAVYDFGSANFFLRPVFLSFQFLASTAMLLLCLGLDLFFILKFWKLVAREPMFWVLLAPLWILGSWILALRCRAQIRELHEAGTIGHVEPGSPVDLALKVTGEALNRVLFYSLMSNAMLSGGIIYLLRHP